MTQTFKLSASLEGHTTDVRGVLFPHSDLVVSCSRDGTVRTWSRTSKNSFEPHINHTGHAFINSLAWIPPSDEHTAGLVASGSQDTLIDVRPPGTVQEDPNYLLVGHTHNVCALDYGFGRLVSGSWDSKARVWVGGETVHVLEGHGASVWAVLVFSEDTIITGSADKSIRIWKDGKCVKTLGGHTDVVRGLARLSGERFASCSNDGTIRIWTLQGETLQVLHGHTAYIYSIAVLPSGELVSAAEDRTVRIWRDGECVQTITHPAISVWSVAACPDSGDIVSGASDGVVRVFTRAPERFAEAQVQKHFDDLVAASAIPSNQVGDINKEKLPGVEALQKPGTKDGQVIMVKKDDTVEAYSWDSSNSNWTLIGTVVDAVGSNKKQVYEGKEYDHVFSVDIQEGAPPLKLPYNLNQNPYEAAQQFLLKNKLDQGYAQTVAEFIIKNTKGQTIGQSAPEAEDAWGTHKRYRPGQPTGGHPTGGPASVSAPPTTRIVPLTTYLTIADANPSVLGKMKAKFLEFNQDRISSGDKVNALNPDEISSLEDLFSILELIPSSKPQPNDPLVQAALDVLVKVIRTWPPPQRMVALDLLRLIAAHTPDVANLRPTGGDSVVDLLEASGSFDPAHKNNLMLVTRLFVNLFNTVEGRRLVESNLERIYTLLGDAVKNIDLRPLKIAYVTLLLNSAILFRTTSPSRTPALLEPLSAMLSSEPDPEVIYRALVAAGTALAGADANARMVAKAYGVGETVGAAVGRSGEERSRVVGEEVRGLL